MLFKGLNGIRFATNNQGKKTKKKKMVAAKMKLYLWVCLVLVVLSLVIPLTEARQFHGLDNTKFNSRMLPKNTPVPPTGPSGRSNGPPKLYNSNNFNFVVLPKGTLNPPAPNTAGDLFPPPPPGF